MKVDINLWELLAKKRITAKKLSEITGISEQQIWSIKNGKTTKISFDTLAKFLDAFDCNINDLFIITKEDGKKKTGI